MRQKITFLIYALKFIGAFQDLLAEKMPCLGDPPKMENGNAVIDSRLHGHYISYKCHEGTKRTKIGSVGCHDGAWIGHPPICDFLPCLSDPPEIVNGKAVIDKRHHGHNMKYECQVGAVEIEVGSIQCFNGTWDGYPPRCDYLPEPCLSDPPKIKNGIAVIHERDHGSYMWYDCQGGTVHKYFGTVRCNNGIWKGVPPTCAFLPGSCQSDPPEIENGIAVINALHHGSHIWYECQDGAVKTGIDNVRCQLGIWEGETPKCTFPDCMTEDLRTFNLVTPFQESVESSKSIDVECKEGFRPAINVPEITCVNGKWNITEDPCIEENVKNVPCLWDPPKMENGKAVIEKRNHGHYIRYECLGESKKTQEGNVHCHNGFWKGKTPKCEIPVCMTKDLNFPNIVTPLQESVESSKSLYVRVYCKEGYRSAINAQEITCISGEWNITEDPCIKENTVTDADCMTKDLRFFNLVIPIQESVESSKSLDVHCKEGYQPARNAQVITCISGEWNITEDPCIKENIVNDGVCLGDPPQIENGRAVIIDRDAGYLVWYECDEGAVRTFFGTVYCEDGNWVGIPPKCVFRVCLTRHLPFPNMVMPSEEFVESSKSIDIVCKEGYRPSAFAKVITCIGGEWNITQLPCIK